MCKLYIVRPGGAERLGPAAGGAAYAFGRERRWPSFIIWRWAGPALDGWTRCRWTIPRLRVPHRHLPMTTLASHQGPAEPEPPARERKPPKSRAAHENRRKSLRGGGRRKRPNEEPRRAPERPRRSLGGNPPVDLPGRARRGPVERAQAEQPRAANPRVGRAPGAPPRAKGPRKVAVPGGVSSWLRVFFLSAQARRRS
jgi:hypothetical protein